MIKKIVIVGATSAIATHCSRHWAQGKLVDITLLGRDMQRLERAAADLRVRALPGSSVRATVVDFLTAAAIRASADEIASNGQIDIVLIAHGSLSDQGECQSDLTASQREIEINAVSPVLFAEAFAQHMAAADHGTLAAIGSVAGDRGRKSNYIYGASKSFIAHYLQGLQHRFANTRVKVVLIKPGPTDTPMTAKLKVQGMRLASVETVAAGIIRAVEVGKPVAYVPGKWRLIMFVIQHLPAIIFNKLNI